MPTKNLSTKYPWLLFDADDTLFDFTQTEIKAFEGAFNEFGLEYRPEYFPVYQKHNQQAWRELEQKTITPDELKTRRFRLFFEELGLQIDPARFSSLFLTHLSRGTYLLDCAGEVLEEISKSHHICLVTNGLKEVQRPRFQNSTIRGLIDHIFISEEMGVAKPEPAFFDRVFAQIGSPAKRDVLMTGDSLSSDILGGIRYGLDTCWFNPAGKSTDLPVTYVIRSLKELIGIVNS